MRRFITSSDATSYNYHEWWFCNWRTYVLSRVFELENDGLAYSCRWHFNERLTSAWNDNISFSWVHSNSNTPWNEKLRVLSQSHPIPMAELTYLFSNIPTWPVQQPHSFNFTLRAITPAQLTHFQCNSIKTNVYICNSTPRKSHHTQSHNPLECQGKCIMYLWYIPRTPRPTYYCHLYSVYLCSRQVFCWNTVKMAAGIKKSPHFAFFLYLWQVGSGKPRAEIVEVMMWMRMWYLYSTKQQTYITYHQICK